MVNVSDNYKLINLEVDGEDRIIQINTSDAWNVMEIQFEGKTIVINENDTIEFVVDSSGELKTGILTKITGKGDKTKIQVRPLLMDCEEIWSIISIREGSFKVITDEE